MYLPGKYGGFYIFVDESLWMLSFAFLFAAINIICINANYNIPNPKPRYRLLKKVSFYATWILFITALLLDLFIFQKSYKI